MNATSQESGGYSSTLTRFLNIFVLLLLIIGVVIFFGLSYLIYEYWEEITVFFTTGFLGWLNPLDDPDDDLEIPGPEPVFLLSPVGWIIRAFTK